MLKRKDAREVVFRADIRQAKPVLARLGITSAIFWVISLTVPIQIPEGYVNFVPWLPWALLIVGSALILVSHKVFELRLGHRTLGQRRLLGVQEILLGDISSVDLYEGTTKHTGRFRLLRITTRSYRSLSFDPQKLSEADLSRFVAQLARRAPQANVAPALRALVPELAEGSDVPVAVPSLPFSVVITGKPFVMLASLFLLGLAGLGALLWDNVRDSQRLDEEIAELQRESLARHATDTPPEAQASWAPMTYEEQLRRSREVTHYWRDVYHAHFTPFDGGVEIDVTRTFSERGIPQDHFGLEGQSVARGIADDMKSRGLKPPALIRIVAAGQVLSELRH